MPLLNGARVVAAISTLGAIGAHAWLSPDTGGLRWATLAALATGIVGGGLWRRGTEAIVLGLAHVWPLAVFGVTGRVDANTVAIWMAALLGLALAGSPIDRWSLPPAWRVPVSAWALVLALGWPIVLWRELDFTLVTYGQADVPNGMLSAPARLAAQAATGMTMAQLTALLVMDWLHYRVRGMRGVRGIQHPAYQQPTDPANPTVLGPFLREVVLPLTVGTVVAMLVGLYQGLVDLSWMSVEPWPRLGRAAGAFFDANAFGAVSALWGALVAGVCLVIGTARLRLAGAMLLALSAAAVWVSGSRTAFVGWLIVSGGLGLSLARIGRVSRTVAMAGGGL
ncbi:MAG TPA: hypothetical protein VLA62_08245, partial [Solirubrobacterales bacterium]|nr:hypothetical protein [Solirubrobacterales bacterium]